MYRQRAGCSCGCRVLRCGNLRVCAAAISASEMELSPVCDEAASGSCCNWVYCWFYSCLLVVPSVTDLCSTEVLPCTASSEVKPLQSDWKCGGDEVLLSMMMKALSPPPVHTLLCVCEGAKSFNQFTHTRCNMWGSTTAWELPNKGSGEGELKKRQVVSCL